MWKEWSWKGPTPLEARTRDLPRHPEVSSMEAPSLYECVDRNAREGRGTRVTFPDENATFTWQELLEQSDVAAAGLQSFGLRQGDVVFLCSRNNPQLLAGFLGAQKLGAVPAIIAPQVGSHETLVESLQVKAKLAAPSLILFDARPRDEELSGIEENFIGALPGTRWPRVGRLWEVLQRGVDAPAGAPGRHPLAFLQFTSGSLFQPKAVQISHENLWSHCAAIHGAVPAGSARTFVNWLPLFHDMGLVGMTAWPLVAGANLVQVDPEAFIRSPLRWLRLVHEHRGTVICGPNSAYALCGRLRSSRTRDLDLSCVRVAFNGSEPISAEDLRRFCETYAPAGLDPSCLVPCYGLAEHTLAATFSQAGRPVLTLRASAPALEEELRFVPAAPGAPMRELVSVGTPFPGHSLEIVDGQTGRSLPEGHIGEIRLRGPSVMQGYLGERPIAPEDWLSTGDLGFLHQGELYVTGRIKELIKKGGRNLFPSDIERVALEVDGVRLGGCAAFEISSPGGGVGLVFESESRERAGEIAERVRGRVMEALGVALDSVWVAPRRGVPKTTSGKLQRLRAAATAVSGAWGAPLVGEASRPASTAPASCRVRGTVGAGCVPDGRSLVAAALRDIKPHLRGVDLDLQTSWPQLGLDSLDLLTFLGALEAHVGRSLSHLELTACRTPLEVVARLEDGAPGPPPTARRQPPAIGELVQHLQSQSGVTPVTQVQCYDVRQRAALVSAVRSYTEGGQPSLHEMMLGDGSGPRGRVVERGSGRTREARVFSSNHYLGLHRHPLVVGAAEGALRRYGLGVGTSAASGGYTELHDALETDLAGFVGKRAGILFPTGFTANLGSICGLVSSGDRVVIDREVHASIVDGCRLSGAEIQVFRHNDCADLERLLRCPHPGATLVVVESVYSMGGPDADLRRVVDLCRQYGALLMVDESHSFGFYGATGAGLAEELGVLDRVDVFMTTLSKSLGSLGGFIAADPAIIGLIRCSARSFLFQACAAPPSVRGAAEALRLVRQGAGRAELWRNVRYFRAQVDRTGLRTSGTSPIVPIFSRTAHGARAAARALLASGVYTPPITHPAVPLDESRLRFTVTASHTPEDMDAAIAALESARGLLEEEPAARVVEAASDAGRIRPEQLELTVSWLRESIEQAPRERGPETLVLESPCGWKTQLRRGPVPGTENAGSSLVLRGEPVALMRLLADPSGATLLGALVEGRVAASGSVADLAWLCSKLSQNVVGR